MNVTTSHTNINAHSSLLNTGPRSSSPSSPHSTPLPVSSASSYTSQGASDEHLTTFSNSSPVNQNDGNGGTFASEEVQGQSHDREEQDANTEETAATLATPTAQGSRVEISRNGNQHQIANSEVPNVEVIDSISHATQFSASNTSALPGSLEESAEIDPPSLSNDNNNTNDNQAHQADHTRQADEAGSTEQEATPQGHHESDEENENNNAVANDDVDDDDDEDDEDDDADDDNGDGEGDDDESDSSDDEADASSRRYIARVEDTSSPDEEELKEIVEAGESSANDGEI